MSSELFQQLQRIAKICEKPGWVEQHGEAVRPVTVKGATLLLASMPADLIMQPSITATVQGEIQFTWSIGQGYLCMTVLPNGHLKLIQRSKAGTIEAELTRPDDWTKHLPNLLYVVPGVEGLQLQSYN